MRCLALSLACVAMFGCPHESEPDSPRLVGEYEAVNPKRLLLGSKRLVIIDGKRLRTDSGKVYGYSLSDEWFVLNEEGHARLTYSYGSYDHPNRLKFQYFDKAQDASQDMLYDKVR